MKREIFKGTVGDLKTIAKMEGFFEIEYVETMEEVKQSIRECEGKHRQQVAYSTFHEALTQICFICQKITTNLLKEEEV